MPLTETTLGLSLQALGEMGGQGYAGSVAINLIERCRELGVTYAQGYHLGRPMFMDDFSAWLNNRV